MVSKASEDLPDPETPITTVRELCGTSKSMFLRLCTRAPRTTIFSFSETDIFGWVALRNPRIAPWTGRAESSIVIRFSVRRCPAGAAGAHPFRRFCGKGGISFISQSRAAGTMPGQALRTRLQFIFINVDPAGWSRPSGAPTSPGSPALAVFACDLPIDPCHQCLSVVRFFVFIDLPVLFSAPPRLRGEIYFPSRGEVC